MKSPKPARKRKTLEQQALEKYLESRSIRGDRLDHEITRIMFTHPFVSGYRAALRAARKRGRK